MTGHLSKSKDIHSEHTMWISVQTANESQICNSMAHANQFLLQLHFFVQHYTLIYILFLVLYIIVCLNVY